MQGFEEKRDQIMLVQTSFRQKMSSVFSENGLGGHCVTTADPTHIEDYTHFYCCYALALDLRLTTLGHPVDPPKPSQIPLIPFSDLPHNHYHPSSYLTTQ